MTDLILLLAFVGAIAGLATAFFFWPLLTGACLLAIPVIFAVAWIFGQAMSL